MSVRFGSEDLVAIWQQPAFAGAKPEQRRQMLDAVLAGTFEELSAAEDFDGEAYRGFAELAGKARQKLESMETAGEQVAGAARAVGGFLQEAATEAVALGATLAGDALLQDEASEAIKSGARIGGRKALDTLDVMIGKAAGAEKPARQAMEALRQEVDAGNFPLGDPEAFGAWLGRHSQAISGGQRLAWADADDEALAAGAVVADPAARAHLVDYITTRSPEAWKEFQRAALKTPRRREIERQQEDYLTSQPWVQALRRTMGDTVADSMIGATDPVNLAGFIVPAGRGLRAAQGPLGPLAAKAAGAGRLSGEMGGYGVAGALTENPQADAGELAEAAATNIAGGSVIAGGAYGVGRGLRALRQRQELTDSHLEAAGIRPEDLPADEAVQPEAPEPVQPEETTVTEEPTQAEPVQPEVIHESETAGEPAQEAAAEATAGAEAPAAAEVTGVSPDEAQALETAQAAGETVGEPLPALAAQADRVREGLKPAMFIDGAAAVDVPAAVASGLQAVDTPTGVILFHPDKLTREQVSAAYAAGKLPELLGYGISEKPSGADHVMVLRDEAGTEIAAVATDDANAPAVASSLAQQAKDGDSIRAEHPQEVIHGREAAAPQPESPAEDTADAGETLARAKGGPGLPVAQTAGPGAVVPAPAKEVVALRHVRKHLLGALGVNAGEGRFHQRALGIYKVKPEVVRVAALEDVQTLAHELGHHIHHRLFPTVGKVATAFGKLYDGELMPLGRVTSRPSYTAATVRKEGVAEFTRLWLTDPAAAMAAAPRFAKYFRDYLSKTDPAAWQGLVDGQAMVARYIRQPAALKAQAQIEFDPDALQPRRNWREWMSRAYTKWINALQPLEDAAAAMAERDPAMAAAARRVAALADNHRGGWQSKAYADQHYAQTDLAGRRVGPALRAILSPIKQSEHQEFSTYIALRRARELERRGIESGFGEVLGQIDAATWAGWEKRFESVRQGLLKYQANTLELLRQSGLLSGDQVARMQALNANYVPFYRLYEAATGTVISPRSGDGFVNLDSGVRQIRGNSRGIVDPLQSIVRNDYLFRKLAEQNLIGREFFAMLEAAQGSGKFADQIAARRKPVKVPDAEIRQALRDAGLDDLVDQIPDQAELDLTFHMWRAFHRPDAKSGEVVVMRDGQPEHWQVFDPLLLEALKAGDRSSLAIARFFGPTLGKLLTTPTRWLRFGATQQPFFALTNFVRDQVTAGLFSSTGFKPFIDGVRGAKHVLRKDATYQAWVASGGKYHGVATTDHAFRTTVDDLLTPDQRIQYRRLADRETWARGVGLLSEMLEEATRVQEFARARQRGADDMTAANASKGVTLNFARAGEIGRSLNQIMAFFNARLQDLDKVATMHTDPATRARTVARGLLYITAPSVAIWALGKDDPEIQGLPDWRKNFFWNLNVKPLATALGRPGFVLSIPKPFLMGMIYGTAVERALDQATGRDPNGAKKAAGALLDNSILQGEIIMGFAPLPTALKPAIELASNYNHFTNREIVPDRVQHGRDPAMVFDDRTSETAKAATRLLTATGPTREMARALGINPMHIEHVIGAYFGTLGRRGLGFADAVLGAIGVLDIPPAPARDLGEYPPLNTFFGTAYPRSQFVDRFYDAAKDMEGLIREARRQGEQLPHVQEDWWKGNGADVEFFRHETEPETGRTRAGEVRAAQRHLSQLTKAMLEVKRDRTLSAAAKRQKLIELNQQRNAAAEAAFKAHFPPRIQRKVW